MALFWTLSAPATQSPGASRERVQDSIEGKADLQVRTWEGRAA
jgi:hypothetical protein